MPRGSIRKRDNRPLKPWEVVVELARDPTTEARRQQSRSFRTRKEAQVELARWLAEIDGGLAVDRSKQTVAETLAYWLDTYARPNVRPGTFEMYEYTALHYIAPALGTIQVQKLTPDRVQAFYSRLLREGVGARTVQLCHLRLSQALGQAVRLGLIPRNVCDVVTPPRVERKEMTTWTQDEARRFLAAAKDSGYGPLWAVFLATGMRRGEVLGLRWQDFNGDARTLTVIQAVTLVTNAVAVGRLKSKAARRVVSIPSPLVSALQAHKAQQNERRLALGEAWEDHDLIFAAANGKPIHPGNLKRDYTRLVSAAGVPSIRIHDLRHTHVTFELKAGGNLKAVSERVGHARTSITLDVYAHAIPEQRTDLADKIGAVLFPSSQEAL